MAYVPGCQYDLFISYASENNRDGWVEQFEKALAGELGDLLGRQFVPRESIFFDRRELRIAQSFPDELVAAARESAILLPILSPGYLTSAWCDRERIEFFSKLPHGAEPAGCLAPILMRPVDNGGLNGMYRDAQRMSFLGPDGQTPLAVGSPQWTARLRELAGQLKSALQALRNKYKPVFLGKATGNQRAQILRAWCRAELERRHFRTVPEYLSTLDDLDGVRATLQDAGLAIHFLGGADSAALEAIEMSATVCKCPTIVYQPFGVHLTPDEGLWLGDFEIGLESTPGRYHRLAGKNDQELLALIDEQIAHCLKSSSSPGTGLQLALVCEEADLSGVRLLKDEIRSRSGITVESPEFLGVRLKSMERLRMWHDYIAAGEALLFYQGTGGRERLEPIWSKARHDKPYALREWLLAQPDLEVKRQRYPEALWNLDQVMSFIKTIGDVQQP